MTEAADKYAFHIEMDCRNWCPKNERVPDGIKRMCQLARWLRVVRVDIS